MISFSFNFEEESNLITSQSFLRKLLPKAGERDQLEVDLKRATSDLEVMQRGKEDLGKRYSETLIELDSYKNLQQEREAEPKKALKRDMFGRYCGERKKQFTDIIDKNPSLDTSEDTSQRSKWGLRSSGIPGELSESDSGEKTPECTNPPTRRLASIQSESLRIQFCGAINTSSPTASLNQL